MTDRIKLPTAADFRFPLTPDQAENFAPGLDPDIYLDLYSAVNQEGDHVRREKGLKGYAADAEAAARVITWYLQADEDYELVRQMGIAGYVLAHRPAKAWAVLARARRDGITFPL